MRAAPIVLGVVLLAASSAALAERVFVKARGEVNLAPFRCTSYSSSEKNVRRLCYDEPEKYVLVSIRGIWYHYCNVPAATVDEWRRARSKGRYFNDNITGRFACGDETPAPLYR
jgi:hypothetical protein